METIKLTAPDTGEEIEFYVLEQTCINGMNYILATEEEEEDGDAYILKEVSAENEDVIYEFVDNEIEFDAIARVFAEMMDEDVELER